MRNLTNARASAYYNMQHPALPEPHPFELLTPLQQRVVLRWAGTPMSRGQMEQSIGDDLEIKVFTVLERVNGNGSRYSLRIKSVYLPLTMMPDRLLVINLPEWVHQMADATEDVENRYANVGGVA